MAPGKPGALIRSASLETKSDLTTSPVVTKAHAWESVRVRSHSIFPTLGFVQRPATSFTEKEKKNKKDLSAAIISMNDNTIAFRRASKANKVSETNCARPTVPGCVAVSSLCAGNHERWKGCLWVMLWRPKVRRARSWREVPRD